MKNLYYLTLIVLISLTLSACGKNNKNQNFMPTPAVTNSSEYNGEKGEQNKWSGEGSSYYQNSSYHKEVKTYMEDVMGLKEAKI